MPAFEEVIRLSLGDVRPPEAQRLHAEIARAGLAEFLAGETPKPPVTRFVDGRQGAPEESVKPFGVIRYEFDRAREIVAFALETARSKSPVESGRYRNSWFLIADGQPLTDPAALPHFPAIVILTNDQPYHRKIEVGAMEMRVPPGIVEATRQIVRRRFGNLVEAKVAFIELAGGYVLEGKGRRRRGAGSVLTYPALVMGFR